MGEHFTEERSQHFIDMKQSLHSSDDFILNSYLCVVVEEEDVETVAKSNGGNWRFYDGGAKPCCVSSLQVGDFVLPVKA